MPTPWRPLFHFYCPFNETSAAGTYFFTYRGKGDVSTNSHLLQLKKITITYYDSQNAAYVVTVTSYMHEPDTAEHELCTIPADYIYASDYAYENIGTPQQITECLQPNTAFHGVCEEINDNYLFLYLCLPISFFFSFYAHLVDYNRYKIDSCQRLQVLLSMRTLGMDAGIILLIYFID
jgi:hypothetical protein